MSRGNILPAALQRAARDTHFQQCQMRTKELEAHFQVFFDSLTEDQQDYLATYLEARQELALAFLDVAYDWGYERGMSKKKTTQ